MSSQREAFGFFLEHGAHSWGPGESDDHDAARHRCAEALARAEHEAHEAGAVVTWEIDPWPMYGDTPGELEAEAEGAERWIAMLEAGRWDCERVVLESLGGIELSGPDDPYRRVIEAELALEAGFGAEGPAGAIKGAFSLAVTLGNDAMRTREHVAEALRAAAAEIADGGSEGRLRDENGNTVGTWQITGSEVPS